MAKIKESLKITGEILSRVNYFAVFLITSFAGFFIFYKLTLWTVTDNSLEFFVMMSGVNFTLLSLISLGIIALLFGVFLSMFAYKIKTAKKASKGSGFFGAIGLITGGLAAGCPTCGAILFSLIGAPLALMILPFKGLELKILSIVLLLLSNYFLAKSLAESETCEIKK